ncbi:Uncharacterised protein [Candidatus Gugararchaeum adminiculabundum]|nr:Uncharacterised protein [Candidatus Gugararchaeum adminiculabundum]
MELTLSLPKDSPAQLEYEYLDKFRQRLAKSGDFRAFGHIFGCYVYTCAYKALIDEYSDFFKAQAEIKEKDRKLEDKTLLVFKTLFDLSNIYALAVGDFRDLLASHWARWDQAVSDARGTRDTERLLTPFLVEHGRFGEADLNAFLKTLPVDKRSTAKKVLPFLMDNRMVMKFKSGKEDAYLSLLYHMSILYWQYDAFLKQIRDVEQLKEMEDAFKIMLRANSLQASKILDVLFKDFDEKPESLIEKFLGLLVHYYTKNPSKKEFPSFLVKENAMVALKLRIARFTPVSTLKPKTSPKSD